MRNCLLVATKPQYYSSIGFGFVKVAGSDGKGEMNE
jgi:hypothetical protein